MSDQPNRKFAGQPPVSAHPAFPVIVALWFAALLGIGSVVLPLAMFEHAAIASGLADSVEAAQPPFGATARIALAAIAAVLGALAGLFVARKVAAAHAQGATTRRAAALRPDKSIGKPAKRPISAHDELGEGGLDADDDDDVAPAFPGRRRALAVTEESARSEFLAFAPLPGQSLNRDEEPLDLLAFEEPEVVQPEAAEPHEIEPQEPSAPEIPQRVAPEDFAFGTATMSARPSHSDPVVHFAPSEPPVAEPAPFVRSAEPDVAKPVAERALDKLGVVELVERFAIALQRHREREAAAPAAQPAETAPPFFARAAEPESIETTEPRPLPAALRPFGFDEPGSDDADEADALHDFDFAAALSLNREAFEPEAAEESRELPGEALEEEFEETAEAEYTSLLAMKNPFGTPREPVRIEDFDEDEDGAGDEPVVVFPGQAARRAAPASDGPARDAVTGFGHADSPRPFDAPLARAQQAASLGRAPFASAPARKPSDPGETERALREALEKLQKMSGAA